MVCPSTSLSGDDAVYNVLHLFTRNVSLTKTQRHFDVQDPFGTCQCARLSPKLESFIWSSWPLPDKQGTQREFTAKLAINRTKLDGKYISMVDLPGSVQS
eukprot:4112215-Prymnesium_polylepis.3